jgi:hypothetical protein
VTFASSTILESCQHVESATLATAVAITAGIGQLKPDPVQLNDSWQLGQDNSQLRHLLQMDRASLSLQDTVLCDTPLSHQDKELTFFFMFARLHLNLLRSNTATVLRQSAVLNYCTLPEVLLIPDIPNRLILCSLCFV